MKWPETIRSAGVFRACRCRGRAGSYPEGVNGAPLRIEAGRPTEPTLTPLTQPRDLIDKAPAQWALGIDIGAETIKCDILYNGEEIIGESQAATRGDGSDYRSDVFAEELTKAVEAAAQAAALPHSGSGRQLAGCGAERKGRSE